MNQIHPDRIPLTRPSPPPSLGEVEHEITRITRIRDRQAAVLVVDDMPTMRMILSRSLRLLGFSTLAQAPDGEIAWRVMVDKDPDLALVDWNLPRVDGLQLLDRVRLHPWHKDMVYILVTAEKLDDKVKMAAEERHDAYLTKPISTDRLARRLELVIRRRLTCAQAAKLELTGQPERAVDQFMEVINNNPKSRWAYFSLGNLLRRQGRLEEAERAYQRALELDPEALLALVEMGKLLEMQGRIGEARRLYQRAIKASPMLLKAYDALADSLLRQGKEEEAARVMALSVREWGAATPERHERLGRLRYRLGRYREAKDSFKLAINLGPRRGLEELYISLARAYLARDNYYEAVKSLESAIQAAQREGRARELAVASMMLGETHLHYGKGDLAHQVFVQMANPDQWPGGQLPFPGHHLYREVGFSHLRQGQVERGVEFFAESLVSDPDDDENLSLITDQLVAAGREDLLDEILKVVREGKTDSLERHCRRAFNFISQGELDLAREEYEKALKMDPASARVHFNLAKLHFRRKDTEEALKSLATAFEAGRMGGDWEVVAETARLFFAQGWPTEAERLLQTALKDKPGDPYLTKAWREVAGEDAGEMEIPAPE